ncbi:MAG: tetratricopeptide repeat protein [Rhodospirillaceae bacterium]|nr:MAG: tetratricopeptide repeat protein [Rhodospirillaceae bacterium]
MKRIFNLPTAALSLALAAAGSTPLIMSFSATAFAADKPQALSPKVYKPIKEAGDLLDKNQYQEALAKALEAVSVTDKTPFDTDIAYDYLGRIYLGLKDYPNAAAAFDASYSSGAMSADAKASRLKVTTELYLQIGNYPKAIEFANHYLTDVGPDADMEAHLGQASYLNKDLKNASDELRKAIAMADSAKTPVKQDWFTFLEHSEAEQMNVNGVIATEEMIVQRFPDKASWSSLLTNISNNIKGSDKVTLDIFRLQLAVGVMKSPADYIEAANLALKEELPGDARTALQKGYDAGTLGAGSLKSEAAQLKAKAAAAADADLKSIDSGAKIAAGQKTGDADIKFGEAYWSYGQYDRAIAAIQRGIGKGVKDPDDAQLRLGLAYLGAGQKPQALTAFNGITSNTPTAQIAHLWALYTTNPPVADSAAQPAAQ